MATHTLPYFFQYGCGASFPITVLWDMLAERYPTPDLTEGAGQLGGTHRALCRCVSQTCVVFRAG